MLSVYQLISRTLYNIPIGAKCFQTRDYYASQIYGIIVHVDMYIYIRYKLQTWTYILQMLKEI